MYLDGVRRFKMTEKIWTRQEVLDLQKNDPTEYERHRMEILEQMGKGLIK